ncbi:MAG: TIGR02647 family protein [Pseudomonadales bacterium]|nr:TIGR02647 family protein [Pseudomonadales bacterium]
MSLTPDLLEELELLNLFNLSTTQAGIKIHDDAEPAKIAAAKRLYDKGMITLLDGGYLTARGLETAEHAQALVGMLQVEAS